MHAGSDLIVCRMFSRTEPHEFWGLHILILEALGQCIPRPSHVLPVLPIRIRIATKI